MSTDKTSDETDREKRGEALFKWGLEGAQLVDTSSGVREVVSASFYLREEGPLGHVRLTLEQGEMYVRRQEERINSAILRGTQKLQDKVVELTRRIDELLGRVDTLKWANGNLTTQREDARTLCDRAEARVKELLKENAELFHLKEGALERVTKVEEENSLCESENTTLRMKREELEKRIVELETQLHKARHNISPVIPIAEAPAGLLAAKDEKIKELERDVAKREVFADVVMRENKELRIRIKGYEAGEREAECRVGELDERLRIQREKNKRLLENFEEQETAIRHARRRKIPVEAFVRCWCVAAILFPVICLALHVLARSLGWLR